MECWLCQANQSFFLLNYNTPVLQYSKIPEAVFNLSIATWNNWK